METPQIKAPKIKDWHAHVYFDAATRDAAWALRERIEKQFDIVMGRFHERPVGPQLLEPLGLAFDLRTAQERQP